MDANVPSEQKFIIKQGNFMGIITATASFLFYLLIFKTLLPDGENSLFLSETYKINVAVLTLLVAAYSVWLRKSKEQTFCFIRNIETIDFEDFVLVLLPLTPIVQYTILNQDILSIAESIKLIFFFLIGISFFSYLVPLMLGFFCSTNLLMIFSLSLTYFLFSMPMIRYFPEIGLWLWRCALIAFTLTLIYVALRFSIIASARLLSVFMLASLALLLFYGSPLSGDIPVLCWIKLALFSVIFGGCYLVYYLNKQAFRTIVTAIFLATLISNLLATPEILDKQSNNILQGNLLTNSNQMIMKPDVYLLTYDSYMENQFMLQIGVDNSSQEEFLKLNGFKHYRGTYTIGYDSISSMDAMLCIDANVEPRTGVSGGGIVQSVFRQNGYETYGIFPHSYFFWGPKGEYDYFYPPERISKSTNGYKVLGLSILEGRFFSDAGMNKFDYSEFLADKAKVLKSSQATPIFVYSHSQHPGHTLEMGKAVIGNEIEQYAEKLQKANQEMKTDIESILARDPDAIIIVNGDHGPYLTKNIDTIEKADRHHLQDRYGSFLAIRWPGNLKVSDDKIIVLQDVFPVLFAALFNDSSVIDLRVKPTTLSPDKVAGAFISNGIISGGKNHGMALFESSQPKNELNNVSAQ